MIDQETIGLLLKGVNNVTWQSLVMIGVSFVLFYLAIAKDYEPLLLLPIGAGCMLANLPLSPLMADDGMLKILYNMGVGNELFPLFIFIGIGVMTDFGRDGAVDADGDRSVAAVDGSPARYRGDGVEVPDRCAVA